MTGQNRFAQCINNLVIYTDWSVYVIEQTRKNERKEQIMNAALLVLVDKGYESSRIDDIVIESGLSKGAIYLYYKSKKEIYLDLVNYWVLRYSVVLNHIVEEGASPTQQLKDLFEYFINQYESNPEPFKVLAEFWVEVGRPRLHERVRPIRTLPNERRARPRGRLCCATQGGP